MQKLTRQAEEQIFRYDHEKLSGLLAEIIQKQVPSEILEWLRQRSVQTNNTKAFNAAFSMMPRKTGKEEIALSERDEEALDHLWPGFTLNGWTIDRLCRVWLLMHLEVTDQKEYNRRVEQLFQAADMNELVALYSSLPLLAFGETWRSRCAEGIRSNIGDVLQAIMCANPYPAAYLEESAWNQMVLKAFFTNKPVDLIVGLNGRNNPELANILVDYAHERYAARRTVNPQLWRCVAPYIHDGNFIDITRLLYSENRIEREAGALACFDSNYLPAKEVLGQFPDLKERIDKGELSWQAIASCIY